MLNEFENYQTEIGYKRVQFSRLKNIHLKVRKTLKADNNVLRIIKKRRKKKELFIEPSLKQKQKKLAFGLFLKKQKIK